MSDLIIFRNTLRDMLRPKRLFWVVILILVPVGLALIDRWKHPSADYHPQEAYNQIMQYLVFGFILVILSVIFQTGIISQEVEQKTIVYLLTRPVPRWRILLMKFSATSLVTLLTVWLAAILVALVTIGPGGIGKSHLVRDLLILPMGVLAYGGVFLLLATLSTRALVPMVLGLLYGFGWETIIPNLPGNFKMLSLMAYLHVLAPHIDIDQAPQDAMGGLSASLATDDITTTLAWGVIIGVILCTIAAALVVFSTQEYVPREDGA